MAVQPNFSRGEAVRITERPTLDKFILSYKLHHPLEERQLGYAGRTAEVIRVSMYHGGDQLYELVDVPGIWHEHLLEAIAPE
jgi:hypothetical protein